MTKERAIEILDEFLHYKYNVDPISSWNCKAHRIYVKDKISYWQVQMSSIENYQKKLEFSELVGGGVFFIDKFSEKIYEIGSSPFYNWDAEFIKFQKGEESKLNWRVSVNNYLSCKIVTECYFDYDFTELKCTIDSRPKVLEDYINTYGLNSGKAYFPAFRKVPISGETGIVLVSNKASNTGTTEWFTIYEYTNGLADYSHAVDCVKKWNRVNKLKSSDDYYVEVVDQSKMIKLSDSRFRLKMYVQPM